MDCTNALKMQRPVICPNEWLGSAVTLQKNPKNPKSSSRESVMTSTWIFSQNNLHSTWEHSVDTIFLTSLGNKRIRKITCFWTVTMKLRIFVYSVLGFYKLTRWPHFWELIGYIWSKCVIFFIFFLF